MQAGKVSSLSDSSFGHADISIREHSNLGTGKDVCFRSTRHVPWFPWQPEAVHAPVSKPAGFHQCLRCSNVLWFHSFFLSLHLPIHPSIYPFFLSLLSPKKKQCGDSMEKNCSHNLSLLIVSCHTHSVRWTNTLWWCRGMGWCTRWHCWLYIISTFGPCFFSTS